jgi:hypothetical protein
MPAAHPIHVFLKMACTSLMVTKLSASQSGEVDFESWPMKLRRSLMNSASTNLFGLSIPDNLFDDWANEDRGYSWMKNGTFTEDKRSLLAAMLKDPAMRLAKLNEFGEFKFDIAEIWDFLHRCDAINEKLVLLSFFTAGQTPHVSEFVEHKFSNST